MLAAGKTQQEIIAALHLDDLAPEVVVEIVASTIISYREKQRMQGTLLILSGALICFVSCVLTMMDVFPPGGIVHGIVLYGLTGLGVCVAFFGLSYIF